MSVEYRAVVSCGWIVSGDEVSQLDDDIYDELVDYETLIRQNGWSGHSDYVYVYGEYAYSCDEDTIYAPTDKMPSVEEHPDEIMKFYELFPAHVGELPQLHVMIQVY